MTITEHDAYSTRVDDSHPVPVIESHDPVNAGDATPFVLQRHWRLHRSTEIRGERRYNHPRRERFVEEAAMSREMFRL